MNSKKTHWPSLLILLCLVIAICFLLAVGMIMSISSLMDLAADVGIPASGMIVAATCFFEVLILGVCCWLVLQRTLGNEKALLSFKVPYSRLLVVLIIGVVAGAVIIGGVTAYSENNWLTWIILPVATLLVIVPPIVLVTGIGSKGLDPGPRWQFAAILGIGMTVAPFLMIGLEIAFFIMGIILLAVYISIFAPDVLNQLESLITMLDAAPSEDVIINLLTPYLTNPLLITAVLGYISVIVPLIEEAFKPLAVWLFASRIKTPVQGYVLGMVSGAAFALVESLNASADGTTNWPFVVSVRAGTSLLHIAASGMVGWGIVSAFREKKYGRFAGAYLSAVLIHGLWNACAVGTGLSFIGEIAGQEGWFIRYFPAMIGGMITLMVGMLLILVKTNRNLNTLQTHEKDEQVQLST